MPLHRRHPDPEPLPLLPSEAWLAAQTMGVLVFSSWAAGGSYSWGPTSILAVVALSFPLLWLRYREHGKVSYSPYLPGLLWVIYCGVALLNPSYQHYAGTGWLPRPGWIKWLPSTVDRSHTLAGATLWLAGLIQGAALISLVRNRKLIRIIWSFAALNGLALAIVGAFFRFSGAEQMLGLIDVPEPTYFFATFVYKNHWAAYGALCGIAAFGLVFAELRSTLQGHPQSRGRMLLFGAAGLLTLITLPLPGSRAGAVLAILLITAMAACFLFIWARVGGTKLNWLLLTLAAGGAGLILFGINAYAPRASEDLTRTRYQLAHSVEGMPDIRGLISRDTYHMAAARPVFGWGPGTFEVVFPAFQGDYLRGPGGLAMARVEDAHDDWLQLLAECGFLGAGIIAFCLVATVRRGIRSPSAPGRWIVGGCLLIALYAWVDFPLHNPAVLVLWAVLLATAACL